MLVEELYDALKLAGIPEDKARIAARAVAGAEWGKEISADLKTQRELLQNMRNDVSVLKWMLPFLLTMAAATMFKVFS